MSKRVLITGASKGIGLALSQVFLDNDYQVIGTSRSGKVEQINHPNFQALELDLSSFDSIEKAIEILVEEQEFDILINNAGVGSDLNKLVPDKNSFKQTFDVNVTGTVFFTESVLERLNPDAKIINISSHMGSIQSCNSYDSVAYRMSKNALNMYSKILSNRLKGKYSVASIHPGWVKTNITDGNANNAKLLPIESAHKIFDFIMSYYETGIFWNIDTQSINKW